MPRDEAAKPSTANEPLFANQKVLLVDIAADFAGQRVDNFLMTRLKGVPKSHIYRLLRKGEVRVNKGRVKPEYRLQAGDSLRIPPVRMASREEAPKPGRKLRSTLADNILYQDADLIVLNKPSGLAVHGGSGIQLGVIESLRAMFPELTQLELVHRLDRDTSGCLIVAKKRSALRHLHEQIARGEVVKCYTLLVKGSWKKHLTTLSAPLRKNQQVSGERIVRVSEDGKPSVTHFAVLKRFQGASFKHVTLMSAQLETGRTHQIRVHCQFAGNPLAGDDKYGDSEFNKQMKALGLNRLFLHAQSLTFQSREGRELTVEAPLPEELCSVLDRLQ